MSPPGVTRLPRARDYERLAQWRHLLRRFLVFSEAEALRAGLTPRQHQALLAIKGFGAGAPLTAGELAQHLVIRPHSAVGLVDRLVRKGLVRRRAASADRRRVLLQLTARAELLIGGLAASHRRELESLAPLLQRLLRHFTRQGGRRRRAAADEPFEKSGRTRVRTRARGAQRGG